MKNKTKDIKKGQVFIHEITGRKIVAARDHIRESEVEIVAESPHADGDFSYLCGSVYCRCMA